MKKSSLFFTLILALLLGILASPSLAQAPPIREQLVYSLNVFDGKTYTSGFCPRGEDTIYIIANENNAITARITLVYFWPITARYMAGFKTLNEEVEGTLELLRDGKVIRSLEKEDNVVFYPEGYFAEDSKMYLHEEAHAFLQKYEDATKEYYARIDEYYEKTREYREAFEEFLENIGERRKAGEELSRTQVEAQMPKQPSPPEGVRFYTTPVSKQYILDLPQGTYQIRLRARDGTIAQDSQKNLVAFVHRRGGTIGYEITPGNRWTMKENSNDPSRTIYASGRNTLYLRPFLQDEYNDLYYKKLLDPQNVGTSERWIWVHTTPIKNALLDLLSKGKLLERIERTPYYVKQIPGPELGYEILEYKEEEFPERSPSFEGHKLEVSSVSGRGKYDFRLEKGEGEVMEGSERQILFVRKEDTNLLHIISIFPLIVGVVVFIQRKRRAS